MNERKDFEAHNISLLAIDEQKEANRIEREKLPLEREANRNAKIAAIAAAIAAIASIANCIISIASKR